MLRSHPFAAGVDPRFRVLDDSQGRVLRSEAFAEALTAFCAADDPARLRLLAVYGTDGLRRMLTGVYETLRSAGRELVLELQAARLMVHHAASAVTIHAPAHGLLDLAPEATPGVVGGAHQHQSSVE